MRQLQIDWVPCLKLTKRTLASRIFPEVQDGGNLDPNGRVMEILSEHTCLGWLEGYVLTGRYGFFSTYEAFAILSIRCSINMQNG